MNKPVTKLSTELKNRPIMTHVRNGSFFFVPINSAKHLNPQAHNVKVT